VIAILSTEQKARLSAHRLGSTPLTITQFVNPGALRAHGSSTVSRIAFSCVSISVCGKVLEIIDKPVMRGYDAIDKSSKLWLKAGMQEGPSKGLRLRQKT
jgi:hypothetical protein